MSLIISLSPGAFATEAATWHEVTALVKHPPFETQVRPFLVDATAPSGGRQRWVLKPYSRLGAQGSICELVAGRYCQLVGLRVPDFGVVNVTDSLVRALPLNSRDLLSAEIGPNFGSLFLPGHDDLKKPGDVPPDESGRAADVFTCDVALDNPDRRDGKSNLLLGDDGIVAIDHQYAFSWYFSVPASGPAWEQGMLQRAESRHFLRTVVSGCGATLQQISDRVAAAPDSEWAKLTQGIPERWLIDAGSALLPGLEMFIADLRGQLPDILGRIRTKVLQ